MITFKQVGKNIITVIDSETKTVRIEDRYDRESFIESIKFYNKKENDELLLDIKSVLYRDNKRQEILLINSISEKIRTGEY